MMWRLCGVGRLGVSLGTLLWLFPVSGSAGIPKKAPDETRLREAEKLKENYEHLHREKEFGDAAAMAERACSILKEERGNASIEFAECINDLGVLLLMERSYAKAEPLLRQALAIRERTLGPDHPLVAHSLNNLAKLYHDQGAYGKAEPLYERALDIRVKEFGPDQPDVAHSLNNLATLYHDQGAYEKAEPLLERALGIRERALAPDYPEIALSLNNLATLYHNQGAYEKAVPLYERALAMWENALGPDRPEIASCLNNLALLYQTRGEYGKVGRLLERALAIQEKALGPDHPHLAQSLHNLASLYKHLGKYGKAERLLERSLAIQEKALGPDHPHLAQSLTNLAGLHHDQGAYGEAEPLYERALGIREDALDSDHPSVASSLNSLATLYHDQGACGKAEPLYERALDIREKALGPDHPDVAESLANLAALYQHQGKYGQAEPLYRRALDIRERALGRSHPLVALSLNNLAAMHVYQGAYERAEPLYERALGIVENVLGPDHPNVADSLNNLAALYQFQGAYGKAEPLFERALDIREKVLGPDHPEVATSLSNLAGLYEDREVFDSAFKLRRRALGIYETNISRVLLVADEPRRLAYASKLFALVHYSLSLHLRVVPEDDLIAKFALTNLLRHKNRVQDLVSQSNAALRRSLPEHDRHLLGDLADVNSQISAFSNREPGKPGFEAHAQQLGELRQEQHRLWRELAVHSTLVKALDHPLTIESVQSALPARSLLIEFAQYVARHGDSGIRLRLHEPKPPPRYAAYLVFPDRFDWVDLGPAAPIDVHVKAFRRALQTKQPIPTDLYDAVMRPIVEKLGSAHHLIIAPAGDLSLIPFGALYDGKRYLIEKYALRYITTGRDLLPPPATPSVTTTPMTIVANPLGANLPDAELEADFLASLFPKTRVLLADQATETNIRTIERPLVLHMATHGFFGDALNERDNPLFRSGLYLADIDQVEVDRERDDGQLTAYEVSGMDLRGTQLVVLSACETGMGATDVRKTDVGNVDMNEGVFGLRRAFAMAGARTTVMSLWEVSGATTQKTMESYYRKLAAGMGRGEAMQAVQLEMLHTTEHAHPKDWAAFIVSGDDTPMAFPAGQEPRIEDEPQAPPPVRRPLGCAIAAPSPARDPSIPTVLLALLGLATLRGRRAS